MAKKRRQNSKKHGEDATTSQRYNNDVDFLKDVQETSNPQSVEKERSKDMEVENEEVMYEEQEQHTPLPIHEDERHSSESLESIGNYLKTKREEKKLSLKNISEYTKIAITNLEKLENNQTEGLPNKTYVAGYVKSYVRVLNLDSDFCLELLNKLYQDHGPVENSIIPPGPIETPMSVTLDKKTIYIIAGAASFLLLILIFSFSGTDKKEGSTAKTEEKKKTSSQKEILEKTSPVRPRTLNAETPLVEEITSEKPVEKKEAINQTPQVKVKEKDIIQKDKVIAEKKEEKVLSEKKENKEEIKFSPFPDNVYTINTEMSVDEALKIIPPQFRNALVSGTQNILVTATKGDSWLTYKSDDRPIKKFVLSKGRSVLLRGKEVRVFLGNINALNIFLNNKPLTIKSKSGVKSLVFPKENRSKYQLPLFIYQKNGTVQTSDEYQKNLQ